MYVFLGNMIVLVRGDLGWFLLSLVVFVMIDFVGVVVIRMLVFFGVLVMM